DLVCVRTDLSGDPPARRIDVRGRLPSHRVIGGMRISALLGKIFPDPSGNPGVERARSLIIGVDGRGSGRANHGKKATLLLHRGTVCSWMRHPGRLTVAQSLPSVDLEEPSRCTTFIAARFMTKRTARRSPGMKLFLSATDG